MVTTTSFNVVLGDCFTFDRSDELLRDGFNKQTLLA